MPNQDYREIARSILKQANVNGHALHSFSHTDKHIGEHSDFHVETGDGNLFFSSKRGFPKGGAVHTWIHIPEGSEHHAAHFSDPAQAHAGSHPAFVTVDPTKDGMFIHVPDGENAGKYRLKKGMSNTWLIKHILETDKTQALQEKVSFDVSQLANSPQFIYAVQKMGLAPPMVGSAAEFQSQAAPQGPGLAGRVLSALGQAAGAFSLAAASGLGAGIGATVGYQLANKFSPLSEKNAEDAVPPLEPIENDPKEDPFKPSFPAARSKTIGFKETPWNH